MSEKPYYTDEAIIPVPPGFVDRSTNVLEWTTPEGDSIALLIHRQLLPGPSAGTAAGAPDGRPAGGPAGGTAGATAGAEELDALVARETKDYAARFAGLRWEREDDASPDSAMPVRRRAFRFRHEDKVVYQCQAFVLLGQRVIVLTAAAKAIHRDAVDRLIDDAVDGLKMWDE